MSGVFEQFRKASHLSGGNAAFIEDLYEQYLEKPETVSDAWRAYFETLRADDAKAKKDVPHGPIRQAFLIMAKNKSLSGSRGSVSLAPEAAEKQAAVLRLINAYRERGHQRAALDPLKQREQTHVSDLDPEFHNLKPEDMQRVFNTGSLGSLERATLAQIINMVKETYCGSIGAEYTHITDTTEKSWVQTRLEACRARPNLDAQTKLRVMERLVAAEGLERYLNTKYVGQKRFSLEGGESMIPLLDELIQRAGSKGVKEVVIGMAHRGRLNVLVNILGKSPHDLFKEFEDKKELGRSGDVKYHMGYSSDIETPGGELHLTLAFNPSHLEIVNPVVEGSSRARQHRRGDYTGAEVLPLLLHGDAAFAGQGVVMETLQMSQTRGYYTGGTVHVVINNQVGFTTSNPSDARSTEYCTEVAKLVQAPIFHVNGDDPEAVILVTQLAMDFRHQFKKDVVIDLFCYRRHGHNEADEPSATQPLMYSIIKQMASVKEVYGQRLVAEQVASAEQVKQMDVDYREAMETGRIVARNILHGIKNNFTIDWTPHLNTDWRYPVQTSVAVPVLQDIYRTIEQFPAGFELHSRVQKVYDDRKKMAAGALPMDWGFAELMAYASLLKEGHKIRLSGQDCGRGTFSHRHVRVYSQKDGAPHVALDTLSSRPNDFLVIDSLLSEEAVLAFEYGYASSDPQTLVVWEAQFGDFVNGAQVVIDQFLSAGEAKWGRMCGVTLFLPHGFEGQGPEHSSARLERFLQLCAEENIQVCVPSTPAQMFHMVRRQMMRPMRKPLVVMTPKALLRHKLSVSNLDELAQGSFAPVIDEIDDIKAKEVDRVVLCSGKVYYDVLEARRAKGLNTAAVVRIEQLYPFPEEELSAIMRRYPKTKDVIWCQEEPRNQGAWYQIQHHIHHCIKSTQSLRYAGRPAAAAPATGSPKLHIAEQKALVEDAFN
jgi:2-oxoglutarate dehydrogenase E1 component